MIDQLPTFLQVHQALCTTVFIPSFSKQKQAAGVCGWFYSHPNDALFHKNDLADQKAQSWQLGSQVRVSREGVQSVKTGFCFKFHTLGCLILFWTIISHDWPNCICMKCKSHSKGSNAAPTTGEILQHFWGRQQGASPTSLLAIPTNTASYKSKL